jgi:hypothetical protein
VSRSPVDRSRRYLLFLSPTPQHLNPLILETFDKSPALTTLTIGRYFFSLFSLNSQGSWSFARYPRSQRTSPWAFLDSTSVSRQNEPHGSVGQYWPTVFAGCLTFEETLGWTTRHRFQLLGHFLENDSSRQRFLSDSLERQFHLLGLLPWSFHRILALAEFWNAISLATVYDNIFEKCNHPWNSAINDGPHTLSFS